MAGNNKEPTFASIWQTLSKIDCTEHIQVKGSLRYLSWAYAWQVLMETYPSAFFEFVENEHHEDGTVTVHCNVMIGSCLRPMWLPVMNYRNDAISQPSAREISDAKMRCLVKCLALYGLGHYLYAGEDIPPDVKAKEQQNPKKESKPKAKAKDKASEKPKDKAEAKPKTQEKPSSKNGSGETVGHLVEPSVYAKVKNEEGALVVMNLLIEIAGTATTVNELVSFTTDNKPAAEVLADGWPEVHQVLTAKYGELWENLNNQQEGSSG